MAPSKLVPLLLAALVLSALGAATAWWVATERPEAVTLDGASVAASVGAIDVTPKERVKESEEAYVPTSVYAEPGAAQDETSLSMRGDEAPRMKTPLMRDEVEAAMRAHQDELLSCYALGLRERPEMAGRVHFHLRIARDGHVALARVTRSELRDKRTEDCFIAKARAWTFRPTDQDALAKFDTFFDFRT